MGKNRANYAAKYRDGLVSAICRGVARQNMCEQDGLTTSRRCSRWSLMSTMAAAGVEQVGDNIRPTHRKGTLHEEEGENDILGPRPQDGRNIRQAEMSVLIETGGRLTAWGSVTRAELDAEGVQRAGVEELRCFKEMGVVHEVPEELCGEGVWKNHRRQVDRHEQRGHGEPSVPLQTGGPRVQHLQG